MDFLVEIRNASKRYGEHAALEDVSLGVHRANTLNDSALDRLALGTRVYLSWEPEHSLVYARELPATASPES